jgi:hypothetical protein
VKERGLSLNRRKRLIVEPLRNAMQRLETALQRKATSRETPRCSETPGPGHAETEM